MAYRSLRDFIAALESRGELVRVREPVSSVLEITEICTRLLATGGPAVLFENVSRADGQASTMPVIGRDRTIMRWLAHRGGAQHYRRWKEQGRPDALPACAVLGADPGTILAAVTPVPDTLSEYHFAGLLRGAKAELVRAKTQPLLVPAQAEIVIEGEVRLDEYAHE